ncbi:MAG: acetyl-CoA hydrolase/transferase family protein [Sphingomonadales bacterium]|nr:acetyl-CoA hydrolase/transferase family protein [Sphingomonadales bacterium]
MTTPRIGHPGFASRIMSAAQAAAFIRHDQAVGFSGFTGAGYPKAVSQALVTRIEAAHARGEPFAIKVWSGASTGPELDGALARAKAMSFRWPYNSDPVARDQINAGLIDYCDTHLSEVAPMAAEGFFGPLDVAVVEVTAIKPDGALVPSTSVGNNQTWLHLAKQVILEVNSWQNPALEGFHDIWCDDALPPSRVPIPLVRTDQRIGSPLLTLDPAKVIAVVETNAPDRNTPFKPAEGDCLTIAGHILEFLGHEVKRGRLPPSLLPLQSGVGNIANAVLTGLAKGPFSDMTAFTEVIQDGMIDLIDAGKLDVASATALSLSPAYGERLHREIERYRGKIVLRNEDISNHPELIRRLGCIAMNGLIEADIYGNVNSTHVMGSRVQNGIGGSGDFARNGYISIFMSPSRAKGGAISTVVPQASHVDHIDQDVQVLVTEQGLADLRGLAPKQRAAKIIATCAHPQFRPALQDYFDRACRDAYGKHSPSLPGEALSWHQRFIDTGNMLP